MAFGVELEFYDVDGYCCLLQFPIHKKSIYSVLVLFVKTNR